VENKQIERSKSTDFDMFGNIRMGDVRTLYQVKERVRQKSAAAFGGVNKSNHLYQLPIESRRNLRTPTLNAKRLRSGSAEIMER
jgi:hypothetical protein